MRIALTGTPGVGKSTLAALLHKDGATVVDLTDWAGAHDAVAGTDEDGTRSIDLDAIEMDAMPPDCVIDSHLAHLLAVDAVWVLRLDPVILRGRLQARDYPPTKVQENLEAEAMDLILQEALDQHVVVVQRDGSQRTPAEVMQAFKEANTDTLKSSDLEPVDWSTQLLEGL